MSHNAHISQVWDVLHPKCQSSEKGIIGLWKSAPLTQMEQATTVLPKNWPYNLNKSLGFPLMLSSHP